VAACKRGNAKHGLKKTKSGRGTRGKGLQMDVRSAEVKGPEALSKRRGESAAPP